MKTVLTNYESHAASIRQVREVVFIAEQEVARDDEFDGRDTLCMHAIAFVDSLPVATGRLDIQKHGKIGRVAVLPTHRRQGIGTQIMHALEAHAKQVGLPEVWFHAQTQAVPFYKALGYSAVGGEFMEAGIPHIKMARDLVNPGT